MVFRRPVRAALTDWLSVEIRARAVVVDVVDGIDETAWGIPFLPALLADLIGNSFVLFSRLADNIDTRSALENVLVVEDDIEAGDGVNAQVTNNNFVVVNVKIDKAINVTLNFEVYLRGLLFTFGLDLVEYDLHDGSLR